MLVAPGSNDSSDCSAQACLRVEWIWDLFVMHCRSKMVGASADNGSLDCCCPVITSCCPVSVPTAAAMHVSCETLALDIRGWYQLHGGHF